MIKGHPMQNRVPRQATRSWPSPQATRAGGGSMLFRVDRRRRLATLAAALFSTCCLVAV
jgi:hypothetical protein